MTGPLAELIERFTALEPSGALVAARLVSSGSASAWGRRV
jgi:hypothetical protein